ncbi:MAG TPA: ABC transporter ATP-binding protein [Polyangiaceae bacterium LLY-WYZ-15_(1-7)]|mgnify:CR=1 FL=1|nr:macrolide ABC transporter ATP-binding protein [Sandaracinus sp.]HJL01062.1 ABC transporter ATP-binding protein [Polyangiaceae bacterium LLY-WYZ-15_(1-7)]HJL12096.1 ABC transporter ATP-binding protein [Polyangiaceae bacterium LLY-WYZ-15_(1-7)]HJL33458.1 ABC transporter ATP-binding protein [Polyangiaceae bacterium LLY-WYZ-15_(1-7)]HJL38758.1 ABC transporter ATP-binding protein [Polyangiaceae bacterium LLY-WYZ-15_(1-7)]
MSEAVAAVGEGASDAAVPTVEVEGLTKVYQAGDPDLAVRALDGLDFRIERGDSVAIVGPSGCGKSTLLHVLGCLDRPTSGRYRLEGQDVANLDEDALARIRNHHIGFVFQSFNLLPRMSAVENVELPLLYAGVSGGRERALSALARVGLADQAHRWPNELSGGQNQRVAIARALVTRPSLLLGDEPTGALDSGTSADVLDLLTTLHDEGTTLVLVTHDIAVARRLRRAIWMRDGRIVDDGPSGPVLDAFIEATAGGADAPA